MFKTLMNAPPHPADFLNEVLMPATGRSDGEVARLLGISLTSFYTILTRERPISPATAGMLGRLFNTGQDFWLKMQAEYDRFMALQNIVECGVAPIELPGRPSSLSQGLPLCQLPMPKQRSFPHANDHSDSDLPPQDVPKWRQVIEGNGPSTIG
jgi:addiction module HigA family antidote